MQANSSACDECGSTNIKTKKDAVRSTDYQDIYNYQCGDCGHFWKEER